MCNNLVISTDASISGGELVIDIPDTTFNNQEKCCLMIAQSIPTGSESLPVVITDGDVVINLVKPCGNYVRGEQLHPRMKYTLTIATTPATAIIRNVECLACTSFVQPQIVPATATVAASSK